MIFTILVSVWGASVLLMVGAFWLIEGYERLSGHPVLQRISEWLGQDDPWDER